MTLLLSPRHGFTLVECLVVLAVATLVAGVALPSLLGQRLRVARLDGVQALQRVQAEQENFRAAHGLYSAEISALRGVSANSPQGRYTLQLALTGPESYRAEARAAAGQQRDTACSTLTLDVSQGFARQGPTAACWGR